MKNIIFFIICTVSWSLILLGFNYYIDPLQYYTKHDDPVFVPNQRYQIAGLIKNYPYDTIFVGTSHSENFLSSTFDQAADTKSINLAISGSSSGEQMTVIKSALQYGKVQNVVWEMNYRSFSGENPNLISGGTFPTHLYERTILSDIQYLFSIDTIWLSIKNILKKGPSNLERLNYWADLRAKQYDGIRVVKHYCERKQRASVLDTSYYQNQMAKDLSALFTQYPDINFYLFIPPMSYLNFLVGHEQESVNIFRHHLYDIIQQHDNVRIEDFLQDYQIIGTLKNYKDIEHYSGEISEHILKQIAQNRHQTKNLVSSDVINNFVSFLSYKKNTIPQCSQY